MRCRITPLHAAESVANCEQRSQRCDTEPNADRTEHVDNELHQRDLCCERVDHVWFVGVYTVIRMLPRLTFAVMSE